MPVFEVENGILCMDKMKCTPMILLYAVVANKSKTINLLNMEKSTCCFSVFINTRRVEIHNQNGKDRWILKRLRTVPILAPFSCITEALD